jgi:DNA polymerase (family 10)
MSNEEIAQMFLDIADFLEIENVQWEPRAYRKAALTISSLPVDIKQIYEEGKLMDLEGIGSSISKSIEEYIKTGRMSKYDSLSKKYPLDLRAFRKIQGMGPKRAYALYKKLGIRSINDLKSALESGKIRKLEGFGEKSEMQLKHNLESFMKVKEERKMLGYVIDYFEALAREMRKNGPFFSVEIAGSTRRMKETVGDLDILATSDKPQKGMEFFTGMKQVKEIIVKGDTKTSVKLDIGINCDLRIVENGSFGAAMQYFTGNKDHNVKLRKIAISKGLKLNEYGLFKGSTSIAGATEEKVYETLGLKWIEPELRENTGEIEAARKGTLPKIVKYEEILGDLHVHTKDSDGANSLEEMVAAAEGFGHKFIAITNHSKGLRIANGLDEKRFSVFNNKIDKLNEKSNIKILKGVELEILKDGSVDLSAGVLKNMDFVIGAMHQNTNMPRKELTNRLIRAIESGLINTVAHPTGRKIGERAPFDLDYESIFEACKKNDVLLEIDGFPERSDLPFDMVKLAKVYGIRFSLGSDAHRDMQLRFIRMAGAIARRGWLEKRDVVNTMDYKDIQRLKR